MSGNSAFKGLASLKSQMMSSQAPATTPSETVPAESEAAIVRPLASFSQTIAPPVRTPVQRRARSVDPSRKRRVLEGPTTQINADIPRELLLRVKMKLLQEDRSLSHLLEELLRTYVSHS
jgi:hypothetical protein